MKKLFISNWRVVVIPDEYRNYIRMDITRQDCEDIKQSILRHVNNCGSVSVECDSQYVCEFCQYPWDKCLDNDNITPICCNKALKEWDIRSNKSNA